MLVGRSLAHRYLLGAVASVVGHALLLGALPLPPGDLGQDWTDPAVLIIDVRFVPSPYHCVPPRGPPNIPSCLTEPDQSR